MNTIIIKGRLTADPEIRTTPNGNMVCTISVAVDRGYGEHKATDFFTCVFWKQGAEFVRNYFSKGQEILVQGEMQSRQWQDKNGNKRTAWEIGNAHAEFCGSKGASAPSTVDTAPPEFVELDEDDSRLPF